MSRWHRNAPTSASRHAVWTFSAYDILCAIVAAPAALVVRDPNFLSANATQDVLTYSTISLVACLLAFHWFRIGAALTRYFSWLDAIDVGRASIFAVALSAMIAFVFFRLDGIPRSVPIIHAMLLAATLVGGRAASRLRSTHRADAGRAADDATEHVILIGATRVAWLYVRLLEELPGAHRHVAGVIDERERLTGRSIGRHSIVGTPADLDRLLTEYKVHGVEIQRLIYTIDMSEISQPARSLIADIGARRGIAIETVGAQFGTADLDPEVVRAAALAVPVVDDTTELRLDRPFWAFKRCLDFLLAAILFFAFLPIAAIFLGLVIVDIGLPAIFWQQRMGQYGKKIVVQKFRTLRAPFDKYGRPCPESERLTPLGRILRKTRIDEIPQLWSIIIGDMSLVGPRPLLPIDQPEHYGLRLAVRPGLTGWAQVNGGKLVSPAEKAALDEWYVVNATIGLDLQILLRTARMMMLGDVRGEQAIAAALRLASGGDRGSPAITNGPPLSRSRSAAPTRGDQHDGKPPLGAEPDPSPERQIASRR